MYRIPYAGDKGMLLRKQRMLTIENLKSSRYHRLCCQLYSITSKILTTVLLRFSKKNIGSMKKDQNKKKTGVISFVLYVGQGY